MRVKHSWRVTGRVLLVIAAIAIAATQLIGTIAKAADPIKVGWVGPLSPPGGYAEGALMKQAAEIAPGVRSEEHTSELQSRLHLVCRLLLEKKKKQQIIEDLTTSETSTTKDKSRCKRTCNPYMRDQTHLDIRAPRETVPPRLNHQLTTQPPH